MADGFDDDGTDSAEDRVGHDSRILARILGSSMLEPPVMRETIEAGLIGDDILAVNLRTMWTIMCDLHMRTGHCGPTEVMHVLDVLLGDSRKAKALVDDCISNAGVMRLDDVALLLRQVREHVGARRTELLGLRLQRNARGRGMPLRDMLVDARREIDEITERTRGDHQTWSAADLAASTKRLAEGTEVYKRVPMGLDPIDAAMSGGIRKKTAAMLIAGTGTGKTSHGLRAAVNAVTHGFTVLVISLEDPDATRKALGELVVGAKFPLANDDRDAWNRKAARESWLSQQPLAISYEQPLTVEQIWSKVRSHKRDLRRAGHLDEDNLDLVVIDYVQRIKPTGRLSDNAAARHVSEQLRLMGIEENVAQMWLSQVSAEGRERLAKDPKARLRAEDSAGGVIFANDAAAVLTAERERESKDPIKADVSEVSLRKSRDDGKAASMFLRWLHDRRCMIDCDASGTPLLSLAVPERTAFDLDDDDDDGADVLPMRNPR